MKTVQSIVLPIDRSFVDTDQIIPAQFLQTVDSSGFGRHLFYNLRLQDPLFPTNLKQYRNAKILISKENFGCGSSREHAVWALKDFGICVVIATSFSDIFYNNALKNSVLAFTLPNELIHSLIEKASSSDGLECLVNLEEQEVSFSDGNTYSFSIDPFRKECLIKDIQDIDYLMQKRPLIEAFDARANFRFFDLKKNCKDSL